MYHPERMFSDARDPSLPLQAISIHEIDLSETITSFPLLEMNCNIARLFKQQMYKHVDVYSASSICKELENYRVEG